MTNKNIASNRYRCQCRWQKWKSQRESRHNRNLHMKLSIYYSSRLRLHKTRPNKRWFQPHQRKRFQSRREGQHLSTSYRSSTTLVTGSTIWDLTSQPTSRMVRQMTKMFDKHSRLCKLLSNLMRTKRLSLSPYWQFMCLQRSLMTGKMNGLSSCAKPRHSSRVVALPSQIASFRNSNYSWPEQPSQKKR